MPGSNRVVLLHPLGADSSFWKPVVRLLSEHREVVVLDLLGHGGAERPPPGARIEQFADDVVRRVEGLGVVDLVGVSLGGLVAQVVALREGHRVGRLVLVDTVATYPEELRQGWRDRAATARRTGLAPLAAAMETMWFSPAFRAAHPEEVSRAREVLLAMDPESYARTCEALEVADTRQGVPRLGHPTLVVCGSQDGPAFVAAASWLADQIPGARIRWLADARHAAVLEQPVEFTAALTDFLAAA
ncbi:alpha/beta fold hydrolase [Rhizomonospora bruguierae]|uniref:alpha/beta fold hydrolase n=1 Tax=Rhizomonospora bruguierae TaxID=1581705 RepID=UPI001BCCE3FC|nr:alpha/beta fold hydrolase [Micromonospora sp. NBRC 107566]